MATVKFLTLSNNRQKQLPSNTNTFDFLSVKIGTSGLEIKETTGAFDFSAKKLTNILDGTANTDAASVGQVATSLSSKLDTTLADGKIFVGSAGNLAVAQTVTGDVTISNAGVTAIGSGKVTNDMVVAAAGIPYSKLTIADGDLSIAKTSGLQGALDAKLSLTGGTMSGAIAMGSQKITGLADGSASGDAINYGQLQEVATQGRAWKETLLHSGQLVTGASGGIYGANVLVLSANLQTGDTITLNDGTNTESFVADTDFAVGIDISATLGNLSTAINAGSIAVSSTTGLLGSLDSANDVLVLWQDTIGEPTRVYGDAGAAARVEILPVASLYEGVAADLVALPTSDPAATNFGFSRAYASLVINETHWMRVDDTSYTWDNDAQTWNQSGAAAIPFATKSLPGKVQISDGIAVSAGVISVDTGDGITLTGTSPNKKVAVLVETSQGIKVGVSGVAADYDDSTIGIVSTKLAVKTGGIAATQLATDAVETLKIKDANVTLAKVEAASAEAQIIVANASLRPTYVAVSGDVSIAANGATAINYTIDKTNDNAGSITVRQIVYVKANGNVDLAQATVTDLDQFELGIVYDASIATTASGKITLKDGAVVGGFTGLTPGKGVYVSEATAGAYTQDFSGFTPGSLVYRVGKAISATEIKYNPEFEFEF